MTNSSIVDLLIWSAFWLLNVIFFFSHYSVKVISCNYLNLRDLSSPKFCQLKLYGLTRTSTVNCFCRRHDISNIRLSILLLILRVVQQDWVFLCCSLPVIECNYMETLDRRVCATHSVLPATWHPDEHQIAPIIYN